MKIKVVSHITSTASSAALLRWTATLIVLHINMPLLGEDLRQGADRVGFEPTEPYFRPTRLAVGCLKPLSHLSKFY